MISSMKVKCCRTQMVLQLLENELNCDGSEKYHIDKNGFKLPFVCGARNLGEALRRIHEGAAMIRLLTITRPKVLLT